MPYTDRAPFSLTFIASLLRPDFLSASFSARKRCSSAWISSSVTAVPDDDDEGRDYTRVSARVALMLRSKHVRRLRPHAIEDAIAKHEMAQSRQHMDDNQHDEDIGRDDVRSIEHIVDACAL